ncbi:MAG: ABC transporter permease [Planctomycetota bacterium]|nr:ABC transporter permease [Planctomycetota bacterium]
MAADSNVSSLGLEQSGAVIARQIQLPLSKAFEISWNSVMIRFWRSMITAGGVVLAIMFLVATLARGQVTEGLKHGLPHTIRETRGGLSVQRRTLMERLDTLKKAGLPVGPMAAQLKDGDYKRAQELWTEAQEQEPKLAAHALFAEIDTALAELRAASDHFGDLEKLRLSLIKGGEKVLSDEELEAASEGAAIVENKDLVEAKARDKWLIALALLVALVGITNAMLMSVTERFREIGTMKCLGALNGFIVRLFLIESAMQGFMGTLLGVLLGLVLSFVKLYMEFGPLLFGFVPWVELFAAIGWAMFAGTMIALAGAVFPAIVAARMEPVVAMRVDQ